MKYGIKSKAVVTAHFLQRKMAEYEALEKEIDALKREVGENAAASSTNATNNTTTPADFGPGKQA